MRTSKKKAIKKPRAKRARVTKASIVLNMLREGATPGALMKITGWQAHSLRGFIAAVARKKHGLKVELVDGKYIVTKEAK